MYVWLTSKFSAVYLVLKGDEPMDLVLIAANAAVGHYLVDTAMNYLYGFLALTM